MIDIHSHFFPTLTKTDAAALGSDWPWLRRDSDLDGCIMLGDEEFRPVKAPLWDANARINDLNSCGIERQLICATPILFGYAKDPKEAAHAAQTFNDLAIEHCTSAPQRLHSLCQVPLQNLKLACDELDRAMAGGHIGVQIGNHVAERDMDDGELIEFLQHCAQINAPVLVHPWDMMARERMDRYMLQWLVGMPAETQLSILYLILSGAFEKLPSSLKICFAHGGGGFAFLLGRVDNAWKNRDIVRKDCPRLPSSYVNRFSTDSIVFDPHALSLLTQVMGSERVLFGTDYPFPLGEQEPGELIKNHPSLNQDTRDQILSSNAVEFFSL